MQGNIRRNGVLEPMCVYDCHSDISPNRMKAKLVRHGNGSPKNASWPAFGSTKCRYDRKSKDERCTGCEQPYDAEYVESLK